jgi:hypothetical protein
LVIEYKDGDEWKVAKKETGARLAPNTRSEISFNNVTTRAVRLIFKHNTGDVAISEVELY